MAPHCDPVHMQVVYVGPKFLGVPQFTVVPESVHTSYT